jgi:hypothetical protein
VEEEDEADPSRVTVPPFAAMLITVLVMLGYDLNDEVEIDAFDNEDAFRIPGDSANGNESGISNPSMPSRSSPDMMFLDRFFRRSVAVPVRECLSGESGVGCVSTD